MDVDVAPASAAGMLTSPTGILGILLVTVGSVWFYNSRKLRNFPPGPPGIPIFGNLPMMKENPNLYKDFMALAEQYGDIMGLQLGNYPAVVLNGHKVIREALVENGQSFVDRPNWMYIIKKNTEQKGVIMQNGAHWLELRKFTSMALRDFGVGGEKMEKRIKAEVVTIQDLLAASGGKPLNLRPIFSNAIGNIICSIAFGQTYKYGEPEFTSLLEQLDYFFRMGGMKNVENYIPLLRFIPFRKNPYVKKTYEITVNIRNFITTKIKEHRDTFDPENVRDFIDLYLMAEREEGTNSESAKTEKNIFRTICDLFLGGAESTTTTLLWGFLFLILEPETQKKCREEIFRVLGKDRIPCKEDRASMPYMQATMNEFHRRASIAPLSVPRSTNKEVSIQGYRLPKDTIVMTNIYSSHMDKRVWNNPDLFSPERFLNEKNEVISHEALMPFSVGRRACIGEPLAKMELFLILTSLLQKYEFKMVDPSKPPSTVGVLGIALAPNEYEVLAIPT